MNIEQKLRKELFPRDVKRFERSRIKGPRKNRLIEREEEINRLRFVENWTLDEIGKKYGITRERVRQIIGNSGNGYKERRISKQVISHPEKTNQQLSEDLGISEGTITRYRSFQRHAIEGGSAGKGAEAEVIVSEKLNELGIENKLMPHQHSFDILVIKTGKRIDVKSSYGPIRPKSQKGEFYPIKIGKSKRGDYADFIVIYLFDLKKFFVIPFSETKEFIRLSYPPKYSNNKFAGYEDRFDLLKLI